MICAVCSDVSLDNKDNGTVTAITVAAKIASGRFERVFDRVLAPAERNR